jgi:hypothetical protein
MRRGTTLSAFRLAKLLLVAGVVVATPLVEPRSVNSGGRQFESSRGGGDLVWLILVTAVCRRHRRYLRCWWMGGARQAINSSSGSSSYSGRQFGRSRGAAITDCTGLSSSVEEDPTVFVASAMSDTEYSD